MKTTLTILISGLLLCGCAQRQATSAHRAIDSIQAGKDVVWNNGLVLHVTKRDGDSVQGIRSVGRTSDGQETTTTADTSGYTLSSASAPHQVPNARDEARRANSVGYGNRQASRRRLQHDSWARWSWRS